MAVLDRLGLFRNRAAKYSLQHRCSLYVPLWPPYSWTSRDLLNYEKESIHCIRQELEQAGGTFTLVDCGADIGLMSALLVDRSPQIARVVAVEPNPVSYLLLEMNCTLLPVESESINGAVGSYIGKARLETPTYDSSPYASFIMADRDGQIEVFTIDHLNLTDPRLLLKFDVEGGELAAVHGAEGTIRRAEVVITAIEAHPLVAARTGIDPIEVLRLLHSFRPFRFRVAEDPAWDVDLAQNFWSKGDRSQNRVWNVIGVSTA